MLVQRPGAESSTRPSEPEPGQDALADSFTASPSASSTTTSAQPSLSEIVWAWVGDQALALLHCQIRAVLRRTRHLLAWGVRVVKCRPRPHDEGFIKVAARCETCGFDLSSADSGDGPVVFILLIVGMIVVFSMLIVEFTIHPPIWVHLVVWLPLTVVLSLGAMRPFKGVLIAAQFANKASEHRHGE